MKRLAILMICILTCSVLFAQVRIQKGVDGRYNLFVDGRPFYIKGVGGSFRLDVATASGANACRTWGGDIRNVKQTIAEARANNMYLMQGIALPKDPDMYKDGAFKERLREQCRELAETFKDDSTLIIWGIGNEIDLGGKSTREAWEFVNELSQIIKGIDTRHLTSTVVTCSQKSLNMVAKYAPSLDIVGINCYGGIGSLRRMVETSDYKGAYIVTEWGPTGWWECSKTSWGAPIEQTGEEKRICYEQRYRVIESDPSCLGSFVFYWGQREERTPTWFSMFTEQGEEGLPLNGEKTATVEAMERVWTGKEPEHTAPVIISLIANGMGARQNPIFPSGTRIHFKADVKDFRKKRISFVWEVLREATKTGTGGAYEPRPERVGSVSETRKPQLRLKMNEPGAYRVYLYALDGTDYASVTNIPILIR